MDPFQNNIYGTNTMLRSPLARSIPAFQTKALGPTVEQTYRPVTEDLNSINPMFRSIYQRFNDSLADLQRSEELSRQQADTSRQQLIGDYNRGVSQAEQQRLSNIDQARRSNQDAQTSNRIRARAIGGAPSSGFLELATRLDEQAGKNINEANLQATNRIQQVESDVMKSLSGIEDTLNKTIAQIESDRRLSLRERDAAVAQAEEAAAQAAIRAAAQSGNMDLLNSLLGGGDSGNIGASGGSVLGASDVAIDIPDSQTGSSGGSGALKMAALSNPIAYPVYKQVERLSNEGKLTDKGYYGSVVGNAASDPYGFAKRAGKRFFGF